VTDPPQQARRRGPPGAGGRRGGQQGGRRSGRRGGDSGTREAILAAARARFGDLGYDRATIRGIAADAGVDPALVHHFYGGKERLFAAAMRLPVNPGDVIDTVLASAPANPGRSLGQHLLRTMLGIWDVAEIRATFMGLLRSAAASEQALGMLREFITSVIIARVAQVIRESDPAADDAEYRAALVASQVVGLGLTRYVLGLEPLKRASTDDLVAAIGPTLDRYLSGDLS
jgi:AcrR family transcriptional regulator